MDTSRYEWVKFILELKNCIVMSCIFQRTIFFSKILPCNEDILRCELVKFVLRLKNFIVMSCIFQRIVTMWWNWARTSSFL